MMSGLALSPSLRLHPTLQKQSFTIIYFNLIMVITSNLDNMVLLLLLDLLFLDNTEKQPDMKGENSAHCYIPSHPTLDSYIISSPVMILQGEINIKDAHEKIWQVLNVHLIEISQSEQTYRVTYPP